MQQWLKYPSEEGLEDFVVVKSNQGNLILCNVYYDELHRLVQEPVKGNNLEIFFGETKKAGQSIRVPL